ncbi:MAG: hypothetical protein KF716_14970 [Anaerolineae bacterium]|nr:hypothetical protein [Anaerolineae bacterium]
MLKKITEFFFFPKRRRAGLSLLPRHYSSSTNRAGMIPPDREEWITILRGRSLARTREDAWRVIKRYPGRTLHEIVVLETRKRRTEGPLARAVRKLREIW